MDDEKPGSARKWLKELDIAGDAEKPWREKARKIVGLYRDDGGVGEPGEGPKGKRYNILWSNTETLRPALYARTAKPDVRRRFQDPDPVARQAAMVLERGLSYCVDTYDIDRVMEAAVQDMLLVGRGVVWLEYLPQMATEQVPSIDPETGEITIAEQEYIADQRLEPVHLQWEDFRVSPARAWGDKRWIARRHLLDKDELEDAFPEKADDIPLDWRPEGAEKDDENDDQRSRATLWEIWVEDDRKRVWVAEGFPEILSEEDDPYGLEGFYPVPEPLYSVQPNGSLVPIPEYTLYQDQASELDEITARINRLTKAIKRRGLYNGQVKDLAQLFDSDDNEFVPVDDFATLMDKGGLAGAYLTEDVRPIVEVVASLYQARSQVLDEIYQITGISELLRGVAQEGETATSARIRGSFGSLRLKERQQHVQRFIRDLYRLKAEVMAEHFEPQILQQMTGLPVDEQVMQILRTDKLRSYAVDIETDSTVFEDAEAEKQAVTELLQAVSQFMGVWGPMVGAQPTLAPLAMEMIKMAVRRFKAGRQIEDVLDQTAQAIMQTVSQPKGPDPKVAQAQAEMQMKMQAAQAQMAMKGQETQARMALEGQKAEMDVQLEARKQDMDYQLSLRKQQYDAAVAAAKAAREPRTVN